MQRFPDTTGGGTATGFPVRRRDSYPVGPEIGPEGTRAIREMADAARRLFSDQGFHGTSSAAIAAATGRSDAAFYQYFDGKQSLFQMLVAELGSALSVHHDAFPVLTPDPATAEDLAAWLHELAEVMRPYAPGLLWPLPRESRGAEDPQEEHFERFTAAVFPRLLSADLGGLEPRTLVVTVMALTAWSHVLLEAGTRAGGRPAAAAADVDVVLARVLHGTLFPTTRAGARPGLPSGRPRRPAGHPDVLAFPPGLRRPVTERARPTVERLLQAAVTVFDRGGLAGTSVNQIVAEAGVAHGSFYAYWTDRTAVFRTLADQAVSAVCAQLSVLPEVGDVPALETWLDDWTGVVRRHGTVLHLWPTEAAGVTELRPATGRLLDCLRDVGGTVLLGSPLLPDAEPRAALVALWVVLTELPYEAWRHRPVLAGDEMRRVQSLLLTRGLFGWDPPGRAPQR
ncbi:TetR/AcrR family transcriptional regulator [Trujillonella humicola]|uniref:TetR/AcrR family transcriptional regulator n=1 Tax=Trujillonella humicola TaxID=3383699 RepID=UPI0039058D94